MSKYQPLESFLIDTGRDSVPMTFEDIEKIISGHLPPSARKHRAWWSNNPSNSVITRAWLSAGYKTAEVSLEGETVVFSRQPGESVTGTRKPDGGHPVFGCMKGTVTVQEGVNLAEPAMPEWEEMTQAPAVYND